MEDRRYNILKFLAEQNGWIKFEDFPNYLKAEYLDYSMKPGSWNHEIMVELKSQRKWLEENRLASRQYKLSEDGKAAYEVERLAREDSNQSKKLDREVKEYQLKELKFKEKIQQLDKDLKDAQFQLVEQQRKDIKNKFLFLFIGVILTAIANYFLKK